ncbi:MAG: SusC/RagA family TonB-linked outer membrane protein [Bacteroidales bacterium]|nr:SusC/RagA family TonB-linked outer membrane protein [Bacteroidales bacterium]
MLKRLQYVSMMLLMLALPVCAANASENASSLEAIQQTGTCKGVVIDSTGEGVIGASVLVKGTTNGTITDFDGNFELSGVKQGATLVISFVGYETQEVVWNGQPLNIKLKDDTQLLEEVVVTAMGIERKAKSLTYATQKVNGDELTRAKETNLVNSLQGKTAGVVITPNTSGAGGSSKIVIRGNKSAQGNNQPLIVIDGMPMSNPQTSQLESVYGGRDGGDALSNLNPDDIASMNVLKGASAAALYGSMAANGVIVITTKKGSTGNVRADFSSNITVETPLDVPQIQTSYGAAVSGNSYDMNSWGEKISNGVNASKDFFRTGATYINSLAVSGGTDKVQSYASYANTSSNGMMPTNNFMRHNMMVKQTYKLLDNKMTITGSLNYINQKGHNRPRGGQYNNPLIGAYTFPANANWSQFKNEYEKYNDVKQYNEQQWYCDLNNDFTQNPDWILNRVASDETRNRTMASGTVRYDITDFLNIQGRLSYDRTSDEWERKTYASTSQVLANPKGQYERDMTNFRQFYGDLMLTFNKQFGDYSVNASFGTSFSDYKSQGYSIGTGGDRYLPNYFTPVNSTKNGSSMSMSRKRLNAVFGTAQFGWKDMLFLDVTGRNDWSSTLAFTPNGSYFYPSVGLTAVISDMVQLPEVFNALKARATYSVVGNEMPAYITNNLNGFSNGSITFKTTMPFTDMKPEKLHSMELGFDASMFDNRLDFDVTFYRTNNKNQYFSMSVPPATGYREYYFNAGNIQNTGVEFTASWNQKFSNKFSWKTSFNLSYNKNLIKELDNRSGIDESDRLQYVWQGGLYGNEMRLVEGGEYGDIYAQNFIRDEKTGLICVDGNGKIQYAADKQKVGNVNSKFNLGWGNTFYYKDFNFYFLIDGRIGGNFFDYTQASLDQHGVSVNSAKARDNGGVEVFNTETNKVEKMDAKKFYTAIGSINGGGGDYYAYSQTNFRLREISLGYTWRGLFGNGRDLSLSAVARNLFFFYKDCPTDPDVSMSTSNGYGGSSYYSMPSTRSFGINLKLQF